MKLIVKKSTTSKILHIFITDSSKSDGSGLTGLAYNSSGLAAYYVRPGDAVRSEIVLAQISTLGTYVSCGFKEFSATYMPGVYELHLPNICLASGADSVVIFLKGAANMAPLPLEIQLDDNTVPSLDEIADAVWDEIITGALHNIVNSAGRRLRAIGAYAIHDGTAQAGNSHSITLAATADANDSVYNRNLLVITDNTGVGQTRTIVDYNGTTKVAVIDRDWHIQPDATTAYQIVPDDTPLVMDHGIALAGSATTITLRAAASAIDNTYLCNQIAIIAGLGRGQVRLVGAYNGTSKVVTICGDDWVTAPDATSVYVMMPYGTTCTSCMNDYALAQINAEIGTATADIKARTDKMKVYGIDQ